MSVKYFNKEKNQWVIFPGTMGAPGKDAYTIAQENGYTGTKEEYNQTLFEIPKIVDFIKSSDIEPTENSKNLVQSGGTWSAIKNVQDNVNNINNDINTELEEIRTLEIPEQIKSSIVNDLESFSTDKSLSANQGRVLKEMISNLVNLHLQIVEQLPDSGESNIIYLVKKSGSLQDTYDEYVYIENAWEKIGNTDIDLSNYYTKEEIDNIKIEIEEQIPDIEISIEGSGNIITSLDVDSVNKHLIKVSKSIEVYTKDETDSKLLETGDVKAISEFATEDRVIVANGNGKIVKDSGILIGNLALKSYVDEKEIPWNKITGAPEPITVDSELNESSLNPVQNKVINAALQNKLEQKDLADYVTKEEISGLGGGNVLSFEDFTENNIIVGVSEETIKSSDIKITDVATQQWVKSQGYKTTDNNTWRPITVGEVSLTDSSTTLTINKGNGIDLNFENGALTITNSSPASSYVLPVASADNLGGIKIGYTASGANLPVSIAEEKAFVALTSESINSALGFTPANTEDIPTALPSPSTLSIKAGDNEFDYYGGEEISIDLNTFFNRKLPLLTNVEDVGKPGIYFTQSTDALSVTPRVTKDNPDAIVIVPANTVVTFEEPTVYTMRGIDNLTSEHGYKCYFIKLLVSSQDTSIKEDLIFVNCAIYG